MKFQDLTWDLSNVRPTRYHCTIFTPELRGEKTSVYKCNIHFCQENIEWSGSGVEQKSGISHLSNLSNFELLGFQILVIQDLQGINFHTVVVLALIFHLWFKLLSALCAQGKQRILRLFQMTKPSHSKKHPSKVQNIYYRAVGTRVAGMAAATPIFEGFTNACHTNILDSFERYTIACHTNISSF